MVTPRHAARLIVGSLLFFLMRSLRLFLFFNSSLLLSIPVKSFILEKTMASSKNAPATLPRLLLFLLVLSLSFNIIFSIREWRRDVVVRVSDGDTFSLADGRRIRLLGVDAPETGRCMSEEAKNRLTQLVLGKHIRLKDTTHDDYGRILASVIVDKLFDYKNLAMINRVMVEEGLGLYHNSGGQYAQVLSGASQVARTRKLGIYSESCTPIVSPNIRCTIKANIRDGKKTYFLPSCGNYDDVIVSTSFGDQWLCTESEAKANGFTKSQTCR